MIHVRPGNLDDVPGAHACLDVVARERRYLALLEAPPLARSQDWWGGLIAKGHPFQVAVDDGRIVGWCDIAASPRPSLAHVGTLGMGLFAEYRGRGLGRRLLVAALDDARRAGLERIELDVFAGKPRARRLYESVGFVFEGVLRRRYKLRGDAEDSVMMALLLEPPSG